MMTLEEAIEHWEEMAELNEECARIYNEHSDTMASYSCRESADEHRQLAEWLKALKEIWDSGDCNDCLHSKNCTIRPKLGQMVRYNCYQHEREVKSDGSDC